jgi:hypothetical protein
MFCLNNGQFGIEISVEGGKEMRNLWMNHHDHHRWSICEPSVTRTHEFDFDIHAIFSHSTVLLDGKFITTW